ncbi:MAG: MFS transporter, partial [Nanoarchaeota archaeon]
MHFFAGVMIPFFTIWGGITFAQVMILQSFFVFSKFALEIPTGTIADRFGRKTSIILSVIITALAVVLYATYPSFYIFLAAEFLWALGFALLSGADEALVYDSLKKIKQEKESKKIFAKLGSFELIGIMVASPIGSIIAQHIGLRYSMIFMVLPFTAAVIVASTLKEPRFKRRRETDYWNMMFEGVKYFKKHRILKILAFDRLSIFILSFMIIWLYQPVLQNLNIHIIYFGFVNSLMLVGEVLVINNFVKLERLSGSKKRYLLLSALISGIAFIILGLTDIPAIVVALFIVIASFGLVRDVLFKSYMNKYIESKNRATVISTVAMLGSFAIGILYPIIGYLVEWSLQYTLIIIGLMIIICAIFSKVKEEHLLD